MTDVTDEPSSGTPRARHEDPKPDSRAADDGTQEEGANEDAVGENASKEVAPDPGRDETPWQNELDDDDLDDEELSGDVARDPSPPLRSVMIVVLVVFAAMALALQPSLSGSTWVWAIMATAYCVLGVYAALVLKRTGRLKDLLSFRAGDTSVGIVLGLGLAGAGLVAQRLLAPDGSNGALWLLQLYEVAGDFQTNGPLIALLVLVAALEEFVWRGLVQDTLATVRPRSAPALTALAYALSVTPSAILLTSDIAGPNPLMLFAALGCGLVWSYARILLPRLFPIMVSHMVFTYFMAAPLPHWF